MMWNASPTPVPSKAASGTAAGIGQGTPTLAFSPLRNSTATSPGKMPRTGS